MGTFNNANWKNIYSKYLFTILVSKFEGFSYSLVESISCGTPIITVDSFESSSYLTNDNMNGTLLPYKSSIKSKAKIINDLITNLKEQPHEYINKCNNALNFAKKNLHDSIFTKSWTKIIEMYKKNI
jgi:glycosyltransferase involved in cell wall biosynthesis